VLGDVIDFVPEGKPLPVYNDDFLAARHQPSGRHEYAAARVRDFLALDSRPRNERAVLATLELDGLTLAEAKEGYETLLYWRKAGNRSGSGGDSKDALDEYDRRARARWPKATVFERNRPADHAAINVLNNMY
jgi:hypothetical protein